MATTYEPIASQTLGSNTATILFDNIPGTYTDLFLVCSGNVTAAGSDTNSLTLRFNGDTSTNYSLTNLGGNGSSALSGRSSSDNYGYVAQVGQASSSRSVILCQIMSYANSNVFKTVLSESGTASVNVYRYATLWRSTNAITSVTVGAAAQTLASGFTAALYGIRAA